MSNYYVYILSNKKNGLLYTGVTNNLVRRIYEHKNNLIPGFTKKYNLRCLVYYELQNDINFAIVREKNIKKWNRDWKVEMIELKNPNWKDLYEEIIMLMGSPLSRG
jgi:putative endonuclease